MIATMLPRFPTLRPGAFPRWWLLAGCLLLALGPLAACAPDDGGDEAPAGAGVEGPSAPQVNRGATDAPAAPETGPTEEVPPARAPLGPELEAPPPDEAAAMEAENEAAASEPPAETEVPTDPAQLAPEIEAAEPVAPAPAPLPIAETQAAGREVFLAQRCNACHSVSSAGIEGKLPTAPDLAGVGARRDRASIAAIVHQEEPVNGKKHPKRFSGSQDDLDALIDWLLAQGASRE